jgi:hypothetical protein
MRSTSCSWSSSRGWKFLLPSTCASSERAMA